MNTQAAATAPSADELAFEFIKQLASDLSQDKLELPSFPDIALRVKKVLEDENSTAAKIARVIGSEPALAARLLSMANSAAFSRGGANVTDLRSAINRLGHQHIRTSAISFAMKNLIDARTVAQVKPYLADLWNHSISVAAIAHALASRFKGVTPDEAMFVGLIHDIGKLYILTRVEQHRALFECRGKLQEIMADWHAQIGKAIVENWEFPAHIAEAVSEHEALDRHVYGEPDLSDVLIAANVLAKAMQSEVIDQLDFETVAPFSRMGIDRGSFESVIVESKEEIDALKNALRG